MLTEIVQSDAFGQTTGTTRLWRRSMGFERIFCTLHDEFSGCGRVVFICRFSGPRDKTAIEHALQIVTQSCPQARMRIERSESGVYEFRIPDEPLAPQIEFSCVRDADHGCEVAAERGRENLPHNCEPSLRWLVLCSDADESFQVVALAHHGLFDGFSIVILMRRFLEVLGNSSIPFWEWPEPKVPRGNWNTYIKNVSVAFWNILRSVQLKRAAHSVPQESQDLATFVVRRWTDEETASLIDACRETGTTVTSVLGVAGMMAVHTHYGDKVPVLELAFPLDLRRYFPSEIANQSVGLFVIPLSIFVDFRLQVDLHEKSRQIAAQMKDFVTSQCSLRLFHLVNLITPKRWKQRERLLASVSANSLGKIDMAASTTGVRLLECGWFANGGSNLPILQQSAATIDNCISITSYSTWLSPERVRLLSTEVDRRLREFAGLPAAMNASAVEELAATMS